MEHYLSGAPVLDEGSTETADDSNFDEADAETVAVIKELIETRVRPAVANDGGDITFQGFREGVVFLHMRGVLRRLPVLDRNAEAGDREPAAPLRARRRGSSPRLSPIVSQPRQRRIAWLSDPDVLACDRHRGAGLRRGACPSRGSWRRRGARVGTNRAGPRRTADADDRRDAGQGQKRSSLISIGSP